MKKSEVLKVFYAKALAETDEIRGHCPTKTSYEAKDALLAEYNSSTREVGRMLRESVSPLEFEEWLLASLDSSHLGDIVMARFERMFLDFVLSNAKWEDEKSP